MFVAQKVLGFYGRSPARHVDVVKNVLTYSEFNPEIFENFS